MTEENKPDDVVDDLVVPTENPDVGMPATPSTCANAAPPVPPPAVDTHFAGSSLVPDLAKAGKQAGVLKQYRYWVGVSPSCPVESVTIAGINFPKMNERIIPDPGRSGGKRRVPVAGALVWLTEDKIKRLKERLPRTVVRFLNDKGQREEPGTGENIGDNAVRPRRGHLITIPTDEEIAQRMKKGKPARAYLPDPTRDVPVARFLFAQLCPDQVNSERGSNYPDALERTGLDWPEKIDGLNALLN